MAEKVASWQFVERWVEESPGVRGAREASEELGVAAISPAAAAQLALAARAVGAHAIAEVGTGAGVSGLAMLEAAPDAVLTTIDPELTYLDAAKRAFRAAGIPSNRMRLIGSRAEEVMERLADASYDLVFIDGDRSQVADAFEQALRILRPGGLAVVNHALAGDRVPDPVQRDEATTVMRQLLQRVREDESLTATMTTAGDGLLWVVKGA